MLINRYEPGAHLSLHQDKNERDFTNPIVSVSLGLPATFQFGGPKRDAESARSTTSTILCLLVRLSPAYV
jgi:alkylated DNA repair dioxygenase AlkB